MSKRTYRRATQALLRRAAVGLLSLLALAAIAPPAQAANIAAGGSHACAITVSGGVMCWGAGGQGQLGDGLPTPNAVKGPVAVVGLSGPVVAITAGAWHTCALTRAGAVQCWGVNSMGQLGNGDTTGLQQNVPVTVTGLTSGVVAISAGGGTDGNHTCALTAAGAVKCWGNNATGQLGNGDSTHASQYTPQPVSGLGAGVAAISAGGYHTCAVTTAGAAKCWGWGLNGALGDGDTGNHGADTPVQVSGLTSGVATIAASPGNYAHTCALTTAGAVKCWGTNTYGQLGTGTADAHSGVPVQVSGLTSGVTAIATGGAGMGYYSYTCALMASGAMQCWGGSNSSPTLGNGFGMPQATPMPVLGLATPVAEMALGQDYACALDRSGHLYCWGREDYGQLGDATQYAIGGGSGAYARSRVPVAVLGLPAASTISLGTSFACAMAGGAAKCWGAGDYYQLGNGDTGHVSQAMPSPVSGMASGVSQLAAGGGRGCAIVSGGALRCWGYGALGDAAGSTYTDTPVQVSGLTAGVTAVALGSVHTCAVVNGGVKCWGYNYYGGLGTGDTTNYLQPVDVAGLGSGAGVTAVAAGLYHTCALVNGGVKCWGYNQSGELGNGDGSGAEQHAPVAVSGLASGVIAIAAAAETTCAQLSSGAMKCWGANSFGQLGNGDTSGAKQSAPVQVSGLTSGVAAIAPLGYHTCALTTAGAMKCWGANFSGQLGTGDESGASQYLPVTVSGLGTGVAAIASGNATNPFNTCAIKTDGSAWCWGDNGAGQLGNGHGPSVTYPVWSVPGTPFGVLSVTSVTPPANRTYSLKSGNNKLTFVAHLDNPAVVVGMPRIAITLDSGTVYANYSGGSGTSDLSFTYTVGVGDTAANGIVMNSPIDMNGGFIYAGSVFASGTFTAPNTTGIRVDGVPPTITAIVPADPNPTVAASVRYTVTFSEAVVGVSTSDFSLTAANGVAGASLGNVSGSGATWTVSANTGSNSGTLRLDAVANQTLTDVNGNAMRVGYTAGTAYTINRATTTTLAASPNPSVVGQSVGLAWAVTPAVSGGTLAGTVTVSASTGENCAAAVAAGSCTLAFANPATRTLTATYSGGGSYLGSASNGTSQQVNKAATATAIATVAPNPVVVGQSYTVAGSVNVTAPGSATPTGSVTVADGSGAGSASATCPLSGTSFSCTLTSISAGAKTLGASYAGDGNTLASSGTGAQQVNKAATTTAISSITPNAVVVGQSYTVAGSVSVTAPGGGTPTGNITVTDGTGAGSASTTCALSGSGTYSCTLASTSPGTKTVTATYAGSTSHTGSASSAASQQVSKAATSTTIATVTPNPAVVGQSYTVSGSVAVSAPGSGTPSGSVTVTDGSGTGSASATCTLSAGNYTCTLASISAGTRVLTATYAGDDNYLTSTRTGTQQVNKAATTTAIGSVTPNPVVVGQSYTVVGNVSVNTPGNATPSGSVTVTDGTGAGSASTTCTLSGGSYSCTLTSTSAGTRTLTASYAGDGNTLASSGTGAQQVDKAATTTAIGSVTPNPVVVGQTYTVAGSVTATAPGGGTPAGSVTVTDGTGSGSASATCTLSAGSYNCTLTSISEGPKTLTASYAGDGNMLASSGSATQQVDKAATSTTISSVTPNPVGVGQSYAVAGSVTVAAPGSGTPPGNVTVTDGTGASATCPLSGSSFSCSLTSTTPGTKVLTAIYAGNADYLGSSGTATQQVNDPGALSVVASGSAHATYGQAVAYAIQVGNSGGTPINAQMTDVLPTQLVPGSASWTCTASGGATCAASGNGGLGGNITLPPGAHVTYLLSATVNSHLDAMDEQMIYRANAKDLATSNVVSDTVQTTLVVFRDGFDGGTSSMAQVDSISLARANTVPVSLELARLPLQLVVPIVRGTTATGEAFRIEAVRLDASNNRIRMVTGASGVIERTTPWTPAAAHRQLDIALTQALGGTHVIAAWAEATQDLLVGSMDSCVIYALGER